MVCVVGCNFVYVVWNKDIVWVFELWLIWYLIIVKNCLVKSGWLNKNCWLYCCF